MVCRFSNSRSMSSRTNSRRRRGVGVSSRSMKMKCHDGHWLGQAKAVSVIDQKIFSPDLLVTFADICWVVVPAVAESTRFIFLPSLGGVQAVIQPIRGPIVTQSGDSSDLRIRSGVMDTHQLARLRRFLHDDFGQDGPQRPLRPTLQASRRSGRGLCSRLQSTHEWCVGGV